MKKTRKLMAVLLVIVSLFSTIPSVGMAKVVEKIEGIDYRLEKYFGGNKLSFVLDVEKYPQFKDTWLNEYVQDGKLQLIFAISRGNSAMQICAKDETVIIEYEKSNADDNGKNLFASPFGRKGVPEDVKIKTYTPDKDGGKWIEFSASEYAAEKKIEEALIEKYSIQKFVLLAENNMGDKRIKFWAYGGSEPKVIADGAEVIFTLKTVPITEIIRVDKEETFVEEETYIPDLGYNCDAEYSYFRGCEGYDGEYEWEGSNEAEVLACYKKAIDENGNETWENVPYKLSSGYGWSRDEASKYIAKNYEFVPVTDPMTKPDPRLEAIKAAEHKYNNEEYDKYNIEDSQLKASNAKRDARQYGVYRDSKGGLRLVTALNGKIGYYEYKSTLLGTAKFKIYNNTAAWVDKFSSNGELDVEMRYYKCGKYIDGWWIEDYNRYVLCLKGDIGEQWYWDEDWPGENGTCKTQTFESLAEFSEDMIDPGRGSEKDLLFTIKFKNKDFLEMESIEIKRVGTVVDKVEAKEIDSDLGFKMFFFNLEYEDGLHYKKTNRDDYERLMGARNDFIAKFDDEEWNYDLPRFIDVNSVYDYSKKEGKNNTDEANVEKNDDREEKPEEIKDKKKEEQATVGTEEKVEDEAKTEQESQAPVEQKKQEAEPQKIEIVVNGEKLKTDVAPIIVEDRTLVPMRAIFEALGADVEWTEETKTVTAGIGKPQISLKIGEKVMYKNDVAVELDVPAILYNDRTLVPVRAVSEALERNVNWDEETKTVTVD